MANKWSRNVKIPNHKTTVYKRKCYYLIPNVILTPLTLNGEPNIQQNNNNNNAFYQK